MAYSGCAGKEAIKRVSVCMHGALGRRMNPDFQESAGGLKIGDQWVILCG